SVDLAEPVGRVLTNGLEEGVAGRAEVILDVEQRRVVKALDELQRRILVAFDADLGGRLERRTGREDREASEKAAFLVVEQVEAPVERLAQRLLARGGVVRAPREERQPFREPLEQPARLERSDAGGRELDRERQSIDAGTDLAHVPLVVGGDREARLERPRALLEELERRF